MEAISRGGSEVSPGARRELPTEGAWGGRWATVRDGAKKPSQPVLAACGPRPRGDAQEVRKKPASPWRQEVQFLTTRVTCPSIDADAVNADPGTPIDDLRPRARTQTQVLLDAGFLTAAELLARIDYPTAELNGAGFLPEAILNARAALGPEPLYRRPDVDPRKYLEPTSRSTSIWKTFSTASTCGAP